MYFRGVFQLIQTSVIVVNLLMDLSQLYYRLWANKSNQDKTRIRGKVSLYSPLIIFRSLSKKLTKTPDYLFPSASFENRKVLYGN